MNHVRPADDSPDEGGGGGFLMMALMMACCLGILLLFFLIPIVGWTIGLTIGAIGIVAMLFAHQKWMGHGGHH